MTLMGEQILFQYLVVKFQGQDANRRKHLTESKGHCSCSAITCAVHALPNPMGPLWGRAAEERRRKVPEWAIDEISFGVMVDPVIVSSAVPRRAWRFRTTNTEADQDRQVV